MELARVIRELWQRKLLLALGVLIAAAAAAFSLQAGKSLRYSAASTQVLVDSNTSVLGNVAQSTEALSARAQVYANFMASPAILEIVGRQVGLSGDQIYAAGPVNAAEPRVEQEPTALKRNMQLTGESKPYRLNYEAQGNLPTITIYSQAPSTSQAVALANGAASALQTYVANVESGGGVPKGSRIVIRRLAPATGGVVDASISKTLAVIVFVVVLLLWCALMLYGTRFRNTWRESAALQDAAADPREDPDQAPLGARDHQDLEGIPTYAPSLGADDRVTPVPAARSSRL